MALSRLQRGCAGGGLSAWPPCVPGTASAMPRHVVQCYVVFRGAMPRLQLQCDDMQYLTTQCHAVPCHITT
eukprot:2462197-Pyramimonas_sp.AAC.1